jgi:integrase
MWYCEFDGGDMKRTGQHPHHALSAVKINALKAPGRYADGNGLYLLVDASGAKRWILRTVIQGRGRTDIGLGGVSLVSLKEARDKAAALRKAAREGADPIADKRVRDGVPTFEEAARDVHAEHAPSWRNEKHAAQWLTTLDEYAFPVIGKKRLDAIDSSDVQAVLSAIWLKKPETARRVRQRIGTVMDWAKVKKYRTGDNPVDGVERGLPKQPKNGKDHHAALPYAQVPAFIREKLHVAKIAEPIKLAFEFLILTAARTGEVIYAKPEEIDGDVWTVPADRMKAGKPHAVPLPARAVEILKRTVEIRGDSEYVFPGRSKSKPLSNMAFLMALRRMGVDTTAHGFRSSFRDWAAEQTNYPREVCEMALAHTIKDKTEAAYRRGDLFEKRRALMNDWAQFCNGGAK